MASPSTIQAEPQQQKPPRPRKPNYHQIHAQPLPIKTYPLPPLIPNNPLSVLHIAYTILTQYLFPPPSHPEPRFKGYWSSDTRSVHITDPETIRSLWEQGFFGKGSLSRSEPTWLQTESMRRGKAKNQTSEAFTAQRRDERRRMKNERAVKAQEAIEETRRLEQSRQNGRVVKDLDEEKENRDPAKEVFDRRADEESPIEAKNGMNSGFPLANGNLNPPTPKPSPTPSQPADKSHSHTQKSTHTEPTRPKVSPTAPTEADLKSQFNARVKALEPTPEVPIQQEHLQLTPSEAFFLCYALDSLRVFPPPTYPPTTPSKTTLDPNSNTLTPAQLLHLCLSSTAPFIPAAPIFANAPIYPDDKFLLTYITYHHFRSLGWTPRPGLKFGCDFLLYPNGPAIEHAPFAVIILASYSRDSWWKSNSERRAYVEGKESKRTWQWWHAANRVQTQVKKGVMICWIEVPGLDAVNRCVAGDRDVDIGRLLRLYTVREMLCRRWSVNRGRD